MKPDAVEVKSIILKIGTQEITLTPDRARELLGALKRLLEGTSPISIVPYPIPEPYPVYPYRPIWVEPREWHMPFWAVNCTNAGTAVFAQT